MTTTGFGSDDTIEYRPPRDPFPSFIINWDRADQKFHASKRYWQKHDRSIQSHVKPLTEWAYKRHGRVENIGRRFLDLVYSKLDIGNETEWRFVHALGRGGFGAVGLFQQRDTESDTVADEVVIKTTVAQRHGAVSPGRIDLSAEAALMAQTNDLGEDGMLSLRHFKYYPADKQWRFFFEYCPYGDLERLRVRYKAYGRYLPELFLWHLFLWLSKTLLEYSEYNDWKDIETDHWGEVVTAGFLLHSDIKTNNIFLGVPDPEISTEANLYPIPRIADLGLAGIESKYDGNNKAVLLFKGTQGWHPPELRYESMVPSTDFYPFGLKPIPGPFNNPADKYCKGRHKITSKANMWAIGAVMFSMMTLQEPDRLSQITDDILGEILDTPAEGESIVDDADFKILDGHYYSMQLRDLIKACLHLKPDDRPSETDLQEQVMEGYLNFVNTLYNRGYGNKGMGNGACTMSLREAVETLPEYKLYYRENEIDSAPDNYKFDHPGLTNDWWTHYFIHDFPWVPPEWGRLWPKNFPVTVRTPRHWPPGYKDALEMAKLQNIPGYATGGGGQAQNPKQQRQRQRQQQHQGQGQQFNIVQHLGLQNQTGFGSDSEDADDFDDDVEEDDDTPRPAHRHQHAPPRPAPNPPGPGQGPRPLPNGWFQATDQNGRAYFYKNSGKAQRARPDDNFPPPARTPQVPGRTGVGNIGDTPGEPGAGDEDGDGAEGLNMRDQSGPVRTSRAVNRYAPYILRPRQGR